MKKVSRRTKRNPQASLTRLATQPFKGKKDPREEVVVAAEVEMATEEEADAVTEVAAKQTIGTRAATGEGTNRHSVKLGAVKKLKDRKLQIKNNPEATTKTEVGTKKGEDTRKEVKTKKEVVTNSHLTTTKEMIMAMEDPAITIKTSH
jgi:hypothetical protein